MKKKTMKAIKKLNAYIDDDRQKLCDRLHDLELSHKRMERLLRAVVHHYDGNPDDYDPMSIVVDRIRHELLYPYFRVNYKVKGAKK